MNEEFNPDGTPKVPEESITLSKAKYDELVEGLAQKNQAVTNLTSEVIELREKKQLTEAEKVLLEKKIQELNNLKDIKLEDLTPEKIDSIINQRLNESLSKKEQEERVKNQKLALFKFKESNKEFSESNDPGGLKFAVLEKKLSRFNLSGQSSVEDFYSVYNDALSLIKKEGAKPDIVSNPYSATPSNESPVIRTDNLNDNITSSEKKIIDRSFGGDVKKFLEQKKKRPDYVATLMKYAI